MRAIITLTIDRDENFISIKAQWHDFEDNIESTKKSYNNAALKNKKLLSSFPSFLIGLMFSFRRAELFVENSSA